MRLLAARRVAAVLLAAPLFALTCDGSGTDWQRFNAEGEALEVAITAAADLGEPVSIELHSTTGSVVVGTATVDPGSGPVGTEHVVTVEVDDTWQEVVGRVSVEADAGDRGIETFDLVRDSADHGLWLVTIQSRGAEGEARTDTLDVQLWNEVGVDVPQTTE